MKSFDGTTLILLMLSGCQQATPISDTEPTAASLSGRSNEDVVIDAGFDEVLSAEPESELRTIEGRLRDGQFTFLSSNPMEWRRLQSLDSEVGEFRSSFMTIHYDSGLSLSHRTLDDYRIANRGRSGLEIEVFSEQGQRRILATSTENGRWLANLDIDGCWSFSAGLSLRVTSADEETHKDAVRLLRTVRTFSNEQEQ